MTLSPVQEHTLNAQQLRAVAPVVQVIEKKWQSRSVQQSHRADGPVDVPSISVWLGAGGSGKTWAYTKVVRPMFRRFFGPQGFLAGAPTHAAVRLHGPEAKTLHKLAGANPKTLLDRKSLRDLGKPDDPMRLKFLDAEALVLDELSMAQADIYHAMCFRATLIRQEKLHLDATRYMVEWCGKMSVGIELGDFFQLRPAIQRSICEWIDAPDKDVPLLDEDIETADVEDTPQEAEARKQTWYRQTW